MPSLFRTRRALLAMGNGMCQCNGQVDTLYDTSCLPDVDISQMEVRSKGRHFPHRLLGEESPASGASSSEATPAVGRTQTMVRDLGASTGECLIFLERAVNVPYSDPISDITCQAVTSRAHGEPSVRAWAEDVSGKLVGKVAEWPSKHCTKCASWYTAYSLGFPISGESVARLKIELWDKSVLIGSLVLPYQELPVHSCVDKELEIRPPVQPLAGQPCTLSFQVVDSLEVLTKRTVYFVRHGESTWNKAQSKLDLYEMGRQTDHPLSTKGRDQAENLSSLIEKAHPDKDSTLLKPDVVYVSPLTRAIQTAVIGLRKVLSQPGFGELVLMANAREKQNLGGFDSQPQKIGSDVIKRTLDELVVLYKGEQSSDGVVDSFRNLKFDTQEVQDRWWNNVAAESDTQVKARLEEFMAQLKYSRHKSIVVVGHSHFFRAVFKQFLSTDFRERADKKDFARDLSTKKLSNCGVARLDLDPGITSGGIITDVELILGTELVGDGGLKELCKCSAPPAPRLQEHEIRP